MIPENTHGYIDMVCQERHKNKYSKKLLIMKMLECIGKPQIDKEMMLQIVRSFVDFKNMITTWFF